MFSSPQADPEGRFTTFVKALQATRIDKEITDYNSEFTMRNAITRAPHDCILLNIALAVLLLLLLNMIYSECL